MLIFTFLSTLLKYMVVAALWSSSNHPILDFRACKQAMERGYIDTPRLYVLLTQANGVGAKILRSLWTLMESLNPILGLTVSPTTQIVETEMPPPPLRPNRPHEEKANASPDNIVRFIVCADYNHSLMDNPHAWWWRTHQVCRQSRLIKLARVRVVKKFSFAQVQFFIEN